MDGLFGVTSLNPRVESDYSLTLVEEELSHLRVLVPEEPCGQHTLVLTVKHLDSVQGHYRSEPLRLHQSWRVAVKLAKHVRVPTFIEFANADLANLDGLGHAYLLKVEVQAGILACLAVF